MLITGCCSYVLQSHGIAKAADKPETLEPAAIALSGWCDAVDLLLAEAESRTCVGFSSGYCLLIVHLVRCTCHQGAHLSTVSGVL